MKSLAIVLALLPLQVEASELYAFFFCDQPVVFVGVVNNESLPATPYDIKQNSEVAAFFSRVIKELPVKDGEKAAFRIDIDRLVNYKCGVSF